MARNLDKLVEPMTFVSVIDEALDMDAKDRERYAETRDLSLIREYPGERAMRFVLRPLSYSDKVHVDAIEAQGVRAALAFRKALLRIDFFDGSDETFAPKVTDKDPLGHVVAQWDSRELEEVALICGGMVAEMGILAIRRAEVSGKAWRRGSISWPRPLWLWPEVERIARLRAGSIPTK